MSIENYISFSGTLGFIIVIVLNIIVGIVGWLMADKRNRSKWAGFFTGFFGNFFGLAVIALLGEKIDPKQIKNIIYLLEDIKYKK
ncbi:hypothetical protein [Geotoga petraea]|uniref:Uncharacterized protein n=1 Tax=Geotoga petraea TaxID=28234 RepID=A0A4Z0W0X7_9BACT|nr:hypothetical protein [Geotoga petraea]TGG88037.1 hypothetical protein E4650_06755 [Geotoga petraea]